MLPSDRLNAILLIGLVVAFASGVVVGRRDQPEPPQPMMPANYSPALADANAALRASQESLKTCYAIAAQLAATEKAAH